MCDVHLATDHRLELGEVDGNPAFGRGLVPGTEQSAAGWSQRRGRGQLKRRNREGGGAGRRVGAGRCSRPGEGQQPSHAEGKTDADLPRAGEASPPDTVGGHPALPRRDAAGTGARALRG